MVRTVAFRSSRYWTLHQSDQGGTEWDADMPDAIALCNYYRAVYLPLVEFFCMMQNTERNMPVT